MRVSGSVGSEGNRPGDGDRGEGRGGMKKRRGEDGRRGR